MRLVEDGLQSYVLFDLSGADQLGVFKVQRRYRHFHRLRQVLVNNYPALYIPPLPPKKAVGNLNPHFVD